MTISMIKKEKAPIMSLMELMMLTEVASKNMSRKNTLLDLMNLPMELRM